MTMTNSSPGFAYRRDARGFTMVELMTVVSMLAIVSAIAVPGLRSFSDTQRVKTLSHDLTTDLLVARSEALKRNANVTVTRQGDAWSAGWTVTAGAVELASRPAMSGSVAFDGAPTAIVFNVNGRVTTPADGVRMTVRAADGGSANATRCVELDLSGRARTTLGACT